MATSSIRVCTVAATCINGPRHEYLYCPLLYTADIFKTKSILFKSHWGICVHRTTDNHQHRRQLRGKKHLACDNISAAVDWHGNAQKRTHTSTRTRAHIGSVSDKRGWTSESCIPLQFPNHRASSLNPCSHIVIEMGLLTPIKIPYRRTTHTHTHEHTMTYTVHTSIIIQMIFCTGMLVTLINCFAFRSNLSAVTLFALFSVRLCSSPFGLLVCQLLSFYVCYSLELWCSVFVVCLHQIKTKTKEK